MKILLTGSGSLAKAYKSVVPDAVVYSFRSMTNNEIKKAIRTASVIIHNAAARIDSSVSNMRDSNFELTKRIVDIVCEVNPVIRFINIGSMSYINEGGYKNINEMTIYAFYKFCSEIYCIMNLVNVTSVRFSTIFYKDHTRDILSKIAYYAFNNLVLYNKGVNKRDYIPINIAAMYLDYVVRNRSPQVVNICSGVETSFAEVGQFLSQLLNVGITWREGDMPYVMSRFTRVLPEIQFSLNEEIKNYVV